MPFDRAELHFDEATLYCSKLLSLSLSLSLSHTLSHARLPSLSFSFSFSPPLCLSPSPSFPFLSVSLFLKDDDISSSDLISIATISTRRILSGETINGWLLIINSLGKPPQLVNRVRLSTMITAAGLFCGCGFGLWVWVD